MIADVDGERLRRYMSQTGGRTIVRADHCADRDRDRAERRDHELLVGGAHEDFGHLAQAGRRGARRSDPFVDAAGVGEQRQSVPGVFDGTSIAAPHVTGAAARRSSSRIRAGRRGRCALRSCRRQPRPGATRHARARGARVARGRRPRGRRARRRPSALHRAGLALVRGPRREPRRAVACARGASSTTRAGAPARGPLTSGRSRPPRARRSSPAAGDDRTRRRRPPRRHRSCVGRRGSRRQLRLHRAPSWRRHAARPVLLRGHTTGTRLPSLAAAARFNTGDTRDGVSHANVYRFPTWPFGPPPDYRAGPAMVQDGGEDDIPRSSSTSPSLTSARRSGSRARTP